MGRYRKDKEMPPITFKRVEYTSLDEEKRAAELQEYKLEQFFLKLIREGIASGEIKVG